MTPIEYLRETRHATERLFESYAFYSEGCRPILQPIFGSVTNNEVFSESELHTWSTRGRVSIKALIAEERERTGPSISRATICGAILHFAATGIQLFSDNSDVPSECRGMLTENNMAVPFCIGRSVWGLPIGVVIYAAKNQYDRMDDHAYRSVTRCVFEHLATFKSAGKYKNPLFDLKNRVLVNYASNILALFGWNGYEDYQSDMTRLLVEP